MDALLGHVLVVVRHINRNLAVGLLDGCGDLGVEARHVMFNLSPLLHQGYVNLLEHQRERVHALLGVSFLLLNHVKNLNL